MKILYLSVHSILEFDEIRMFHELGYEVFSAGAYIDPENPHDPKRPPIPGMKVNQDWLEQYHRLGRDGIDNRLLLTNEFLDNFDVIIVMHNPQWISTNWPVFYGRRVIWRTIGQSVASLEKRMKHYKDEGLEIVRYSPQEAHIPHFAGQDGLIRFGKKKEDYGPWTGENKQVITFAQDMKNRGAACNYEVFEKATRGLQRHLFGPGNEGQDWTSGAVPYEQLQRELRTNRVYFYTGTHPASYTLNFIEALMTGIPIVAIGPKWGNADHLRNHNLYEIPYLIEDGRNGFVSDSEEELKAIVKDLFADDSLAEMISAQGRQLAIKHFDSEMIKGAWRGYLER